MYISYNENRGECMKKIKLHNNVEIPIVGLGTWQSKQDDAYHAVLSALEAGYRHIDTAMIYGNEEEVGRAIRDSKLQREELFITTKLWNTDQGYESTKKAISDSLQRLGLDYIDLYLIHWFKGYENGLSSWRAMEEAYEAGLLKAIGVSNHNVHHLMYLIENAKIPPMINQVETHIELQNHFLQDFCSKNNIALEAYAPLMSWKVTELLENADLKELALKYNKTVPQIALRWLIQRDIVILPKSTNKDRIKANIELFDFELSDADMEHLKQLNKGNKLFPEFDNVRF